MYYSIWHQTKFRYSHAVSESIMELRLQPRTEWTQHCLSFEIATAPRSRLLSYRDYLGNIVHHFNVPGQHQELTILARSLVEVAPFLDWPERLLPDAWGEIDAQVHSGDYYEMLMPSDFAKPSGLLSELAAKLHATRRDDPLTVLRQLTAGIFHHFEYVPKATRVDSPIDEALRTGRGVCQDFAHILITLVRQLRIPCRYVSGYLAPGEAGAGRMSTTRSSHAWVEAWLPGWGWVGFDPTINKMVGERHIRIAVGRDYADVPPTKGVYRGESRGELSVHVQVTPTEGPTSLEAEFNFPIQDQWIAADQSPPEHNPDEYYQPRRQHQQQQQQ
mgnify:CR=1 FL=1